MRSMCSCTKSCFIFCRIKSTRFLYTYIDTCKHTYIIHVLLLLLLFLGELHWMLVAFLITCFLLFKQPLIYLSIYLFIIIIVIIVINTIIIATRQDRAREHTAKHRTEYYGDDLYQETHTYQVSVYMENVKQQHIRYIA